MGHCIWRASADIFFLYATCVFTWLHTQSRGTNWNHVRGDLAVWYEGTHIYDDARVVWLAH